MIPVEESNVRPMGNVPVMLQVIGVLPVTVRPDEYGLPSSDCARFPESFGAVPFILSVNVLRVMPAEFSAEIFTVKSPFAVGLPEIFPLSLIESPPGSPSADHVIGFVPFAFIVAL